MSEESSRQGIINTLRRTNMPVGEEIPPAVASPVPSCSPAERVARFIAGAEAANASVRVAAEHEEALRLVADVLSTVEGRQVIVSDDAWHEPWGVARLSGIDEREIRRTSSLQDPSPSGIAASASVGITAAACGVSETGTVVVCSGPAGGRIESLLPPVHIALLAASRLVAGLPEVFALLEREGWFERSSAVTFITGPSRTADIELTLTIGVHGPKQLVVILVNDVPEASS
jgi:L-lactate dehydrogenase complex protein LldG